MKIKTLEVAGIGPAIHALRNPFQNYDKSDTVHGHVGQKDRELSEKLAHAGGSHSKHLRMIQVWAEVWAPLYWWKEADTYKVGTVRLSTSTMHSIMNSEFTSDMFTDNVDDGVLSLLNMWRRMYLETDNTDSRKVYWRKIIENLPSGYIQRATLCMSYQAVRHMYEDRAGHRLSEWQQFRDWCETLPESWMITGKLPETNKEDEDE